MDKVMGAEQVCLYAPPNPPPLAIETSVNKNFTEGLNGALIDGQGIGSPVHYPPHHVKLGYDFGLVWLG